MSPVGLILVVLGLAASYQAATKGPMLLAAAVAVLVAVFLRARVSRANKALKTFPGVKAMADPWGRSSRAERRALARAMSATMAMTALVAMFPAPAAKGTEIAQRLRLA